MKSGLEFIYQTKKRGKGGFVIDDFHVLPTSSRKIYKI